MVTLTLEERNQALKGEGRKITASKLSQGSPLYTRLVVQGKAVWLAKAVNYDYIYITDDCFRCNIRGS